MGVVNLWTELVKYANVCRSWSGSARSTAAGGEPRDENAEIVTELCGKILAIDTSVWLFQCSQQNDLRDAIFDEHARVLYIFIYRIMNLLRYGVTPVFVLEGDTPEAKMGRLNQRSLARGFSGRAVGNRRGGRHDALGRKVVELLDAMGIPHVDAPGEAEAMCAALTVVGLAHAAVTSDVDALLFGARRVYKECRVQMDSVKLNCVERVDATEAAKRCFGLRDETASCVRALQAVACLCGCDYSVAGGKGVGVKTALEAVQQLTVGRQDDSQVLPELLRYLETGPDPRVTALTKCTGCKTCGHEKHGRQPCAVCGPGPCRPKGETSPCECEFHRSEPQRKFMRVIARAVTTGPSFSSECRATIAAFESETQRAARAAEELRRRVGALSWSRRPDTQAVFSLMHPLLGHTSADPNKLLWTYPEVRDRMRPVLVEWDMRQGPEPSAPALSMVEFRPRRIKQVAAKDGGLWAYLMEFERLPGVNPADAAFDSQQLSNSKLVKGRHVRRTIVDALWPHLLTLKEEEEQAKLAKPKKGRGGGKAAASGGSPGSISGPSDATAAATAAVGPSVRGGSRLPGGAAGPAASGGVSRSGVSAGSSDVMHRFLRMGAAAAPAGPTTSVQQPPPLQQQPRQAAYGLQAGGSAAAAVAGQDLGGEGDEGDDWMDCEVQMTQRNDGPGRTAAAAATGAAGAGAAGPSQPTAFGGHSTGAEAAAAGRGGNGHVVALWDDADAGDEHGGEYDDRTGEEAGGRGALFDDLDDVIPTSLDELLACASQPVDRGHQPSKGRCNGHGHAPQRHGRRAAAPDAAAAAPAAATAAGPPIVGPFRPHPTGPGPGRPGPASGRGGGGRAEAHPAPLEVFDLTDSPVPCTAPRATNPYVVTATAAITDSESGRDQLRAEAGGSGENCPGRPGGRGFRGGGGLGSRDSGAFGEEAEEEAEEQQQQRVEDEDGALSSAVKPARRLGAGAAAGWGTRDLGPEQQQHGVAEAAADVEPGSGGEEGESPAARRARLRRSLFPDVPEGEPRAVAAAAAQPRKADGAAVVMQRVEPQQERRSGAGSLGSPAKRQNTGDGGGGGGGGSGGCGEENGHGGRLRRAAAAPSAAGQLNRPAAAAAAAAGGTAVAVAAAAAPAVIADHVDLTLTDDDDDSVVDLT